MSIPSFLHSAALLLASLSCMAFSASGLAMTGQWSVYGADNCEDDCDDDEPLVIDECRHLNADDNPPNDCESEKCTKNIIYRAHCTEITEGEDCDFAAPANGTWVTQERRTATNCTTTNPTTWTEHDPGACEWHHHAETRCETESCTGAKWAADLTRQDDIRQCS